ncbi:LOW QUALITY PROTEIN: kinetochore protein NUF2 homolog [Dioscorea cayenensis subsp. rotundata]|uniref:LOW QUALITY PROTEIN: kinetochore protein NUF2 homolog n=1 Tax=Dioscorea cayennensis subsp. rotundata TaxID=55577 RepID=A0AB40CD15_DIOCR|nr:LOW QUALITY PROTEIN: kinetochore protein NUF2 homolog [Dioscorea cayenensis subsp. rotundata]
MASTFTCPEMPAAEIISILAQTGIATLKPEDLAAPTAELMCSLYANFLSYLDPLGDDLDGQIGFGALELLENPDNHADSIRIFNLYRKVKDLLGSIRFGNFTLRDLLKPDARRTGQILSTIVNFLFYREDKLNMLQPIVDQFPAYEERRIELEEKITQLNKEILDHEVACQMEEPIVQELDAEVKQLRQTIQNYNKQQMSLKALFKELKDKNEAINEKISHADFVLSESAQENSKLLSKIVQSPDKLQRALDEKKIKRAEIKNSERSAMQIVQAKTSTLEAYTKAFDKMSKHFAQVQAIQEQVNSVKVVDKDVKALKAKLGDQGVLNMSLEAKIVERQGKAKQSEDLIKAMEKERDVKHSEATQKLESVRAEMEWKLHRLEPRERKAEAMVGKGEMLLSEADSIRQAANAQQQELLGKQEEIVRAFHSYSNLIMPFFQRAELAVEKEPLGTGISD